MAYASHILLAVVVAIAFSWQIINASRHSTRLGFSLAAVGLSLVGYTLLRVPQIEAWLFEVTGVVAFSALGKDLMFSATAAGCVLSWKLWDISFSWRVVGWVAIALQAGLTITSWLLSRQTCPLIFDNDFEACAFRLTTGLWGEASALIILAIISTITVLRLASFIKLDTPEGQAALILVIGGAGLILWSLVSALEAFDVYFTGKQGLLYRATHTPLMLVGVGATFTAVLYLPLYRTISTVRFFREAKPVLDALDFGWRDAIVLAGASGNTVTDTMDALGKMLDEHNVTIQRSSTMEGVAMTADFLRGRSTPDTLTVP